MCTASVTSVRMTMICVVELVSCGLQHRVADLTYALAKVDPDALTGAAAATKVDPDALTGAAAATELLLTPEAGVVASQPDALPGRYV